MAILLTVCSMILAAGVCLISYIAVNRRLALAELQASLKNETEALNLDVDDSAEKAESEDSKHNIREKKSLIEEVKQVFNDKTVSKAIAFGISILLVGAVTYCAQTFTWGGTGIDTVGIIKVVITALLMMSAAVIDLYTKKIPNILPICFLVAGIVLLAVEFIFMRESFGLLALSSFVGLIGGFILLIIMFLVTKSGIGMGDVKLISTMGFVSGVAAAFNSFLVASVLCLIVTLFLLITKLKKMKDQLPFGPFLFLGYIITVFLGRF